MRQHLATLGFVLWSVVLLAACSAGSPTTTQEVRLAPLSEMPRWVQSAPARVRTAYQFAAAHPEALQNVPCYCGCGSIGHTSNLACYIQEVRANGNLAFDDHALGCSLCVDIAQDVLRLTREGRSSSDIRAEIVATYSKYGPPNQ